MAPGRSAGCRCGLSDPGAIRVTRVIAHRCRSGGAAENLASGVALAATAGAQAIEVDVRPSRDGEAVVTHDRWLLRRTWWPVPVRAVTAAWFRARRDRTTGEQLPDLQAIVTEAARCGIGVVVDLKDGRALAAVASVLAGVTTIERDIWVRDPTSIARARALVPGATVGWLDDPRSPGEVDAYLDAARDHGADLVSVRHHLVGVGTVERCRASSMRLAVWITDPAATAAVLALGPDAVVTDRPELAVPGP
jgi:glycerophosphoryl diester phosphodiesterase